jgi:very-short-patch-repair endonuclease
MSEQIFNSPQYTAKRQTLRSNPTQPEQTLWALLRGKQLGVKFRRQHGIGHYIVDFYSPESKLIIEVDGDSHYTAEGKSHDQMRDAYMVSLGLKVLRFTNAEVMQNMAGVYDAIKGAIDEKKVL